MARNTNKVVASTEYAVEVRDERTNKFLRQIETFPDYEKAEAFAEAYEKENKLAENEEINIIFIDYDENGDEIGFGTVC